LTSGPPLLTVLTGPSAVGKDSVLARLRELLPGAHFTITATTRAPRASERDGVDYYFYSVSEFEAMIERGELLEHARVYGDWKGVPKAPIVAALRAGRDVLMRTDVQGARYIQSAFPGAVTIFVNPPSREELERRLRDRAADDEEQARVRMKIASEEMAGAGEFGHAVVNDDLERCARDITAILERERLSPDRKAVVVD
jgi:guanylate kinase